MHSPEISNLEQLERQVYESTWSDGLIDVCTGFALLAIGILWVSGQSAYSTIVAPLMVPVWVAARKRITEPRMGLVKFGTERIGKERKQLLGLFLLGVAAFVFGLTWYFFGVNDASIDLLQKLNIIAGLPAALLAIPAFFVALTLGLPRFMVYGALLLVAAIPVVLFDVHPGWAFIPAGALCLALGSFLLVRFLNRHPVGA